MPKLPPLPPKPAQSTSLLSEFQPEHLSTQIQENQPPNLPKALRRRKPQEAPSQNQEISPAEVIEKRKARRKAPYGHFFIYALTDPDTNQVFYVGRSKHPYSRFLQHVTEAQKSSTKSQEELDALFGWMFHKRKSDGNMAKLRWLQNISDRDKIPGIVLLDEWQVQSVTNANRLEDAWIATMRHQGEPLQNRILSHRMESAWYAKYGYKNPQDYIEKLKAGLVRVAVEDEESLIPTRRKRRSFKNRKPALPKRLSNHKKSTKKPIRRKKR